MKKRHLVYAIGLIVGMGACAASAKKQAESKPDVWKSYNVGTILFEDKNIVGVPAHKIVKRKVRTFITGLFRMRSLISRSRPVLYWPLFTIRRKTASLR